MPELNNIDGLLAGIDSSKPQEINKNTTDVSNDSDSIQDSNEEFVGKEENEYVESTESQEITKENEENQTKVKESSIDEYGNPVEKKKLYTEEEVQNKIRDRLSRVKNHKEHQSTQQTNQSAQDFQVDPNSEESWEVQLESFIEKTLDKRQSKINEKQWMDHELAKQSEFEEKFTSGMSKYSDFNKVVSGKPITDSMMMAARSLDNPAAFIYGASKLHPNELNRIATIKDPYAQAAEVGRLHEKMIKESKKVSSASKPVETPKSDIGQKASNIPSIDQRIQEHAKRKLK